VRSSEDDQREEQSKGAHPDGVCRRGRSPSPRDQMGCAWSVQPPGRRSRHGLARLAVRRVSPQAIAGPSARSGARGAR
jgi:hypothetical protein